jgi:hypothetical protein
MLGLRLVESPSTGPWSILRLLELMDNALDSGDDGRLGIV